MVRSRVWPHASVWRSWLSKPLDLRRPRRSEAPADVQRRAAPAACSEGTRGGLSLRDEHRHHHAMDVARVCQ